MNPTTNESMKSTNTLKLRFSILVAAGALLLSAGCVSPTVPAVNVETKEIGLGKGVKLEMVRLPNDLWFGKYEVTQNQWMRLMGNNPSLYQGGMNPVGMVSWNDCLEFVEKLNALPAAKESGLAFRMPDDDEWLFAATAGAEGDDAVTKLPDGSELKMADLGRIAWIEDTAGHWQHPVGKKMPNAFGLYDMVGNAMELTRPKQSNASYFNRRGGWHGDRAEECMKASHCAADATNPACGFRLCADPAANQ